VKTLDCQHSADAQEPVREPALDAGAAKRRDALRRGHLDPFIQGRLPPGCNWVMRHVNRLRRLLEAELVKRHKSLSIFHQATIQSTCRHECRAILLQRLLRERSTELSVADYLHLTQAITNSSDRRDRCLRALGLDAQPSLAAQLFGAAAARSQALGQLNGSEAQSTPSNAGDT